MYVCMYRERVSVCIFLKCFGFRRGERRSSAVCVVYYTRFFFVFPHPGIKNPGNRRLWCRHSFRVLRFQWIFIFKNKNIVYIHNISKTRSYIVCMCVCLYVFVGRNRTRQNFKNKTKSNNSERWCHTSVFFFLVFNRDTCARIDAIVY